MDLGYAWELVLRFVEFDWETIILICASIFALKAVKVVNGGLYSQIANWAASAMASGLFKSVTLTNGLRFVVLAAGSALLYHFVSKLVIPQGKNLLAQLTVAKK